MGYDASLQGGIFNRTSPYTIPSQDVKRLLGIFMASAVLELKCHQLLQPYLCLIHPAPRIENDILFVSDPITIILIPLECIFDLVEVARQPTEDSKGSILCSIIKYLRVICGCCSLLEKALTVLVPQVFRSSRCPLLTSSKKIVQSVHKDKVICIR